MLSQNAKLTSDAHDGRRDHIDRQAENVHEKVGVVLFSYAVVHPLAVVVEFRNALVADVTVPRVRGAEYLTGWAQNVGVKLFYQEQERYWGRAF